MISSNEGEIRKDPQEDKLIESMVVLCGQLFTNTQIARCIYLFLPSV